MKEKHDDEVTLSVRSLETVSQSINRSVSQLIDQSVNVLHIQKHKKVDFGTTQANSRSKRVTLLYPVVALRTAKPLRMRAKFIRVNTEVDGSIPYGNCFQTWVFYRSTVKGCRSTLSSPETNDENSMVVLCVSQYCTSSNTLVPLG
jgi:hypothetical protein